MKVKGIEHVIVRSLSIAVLVVLGLGAAVASTHAAPQAPAARGGRQASPNPVPPAAAGDPTEPADSQSIPEPQLAAMLDTFAIVQAQQALSIPDEQYGTFAARFKKLQDVRRRNQRLHRQLLQELRQMAGPKAAVPADDAAIRKQLTALREQDERAAIEMRQAYDALDEVLDARQQARFRVFEDQIEQRKLDLLMRARERARANKAAGTR